MKPTFALDLSRDAIALLHRTSRGWLSVGEVGFDAPDLADALEYLRKTALGLSPMGMATKIVLPASQILYAELSAPGPSHHEKVAQITAALEGRTPYAVSDLVFDWAGDGPLVQVAVVARETLDEAEAFAVGNRLNPVSFVAIPEPGQFPGEVWFGPTAAAQGLLASGESVERDSEAVVIVQREFPLAEVAAVVPEASFDDIPGLREALDIEPEVSPTAGLPEALPKAPPEAPPVAAEVEDEGSNLPVDTAIAQPSSANSGATPGLGLTPAVDDPTTIPTPEAVADGGVAEAPFAEVPPEDAEELEAEIESAALQASLSEAILQKELALRGLLGTDQGITSPPVEVMPAAPVAAAAQPAPAAELDDLLDDVPPAPSPAAMLAFSSRRSAAANAALRPAGPVAAAVALGGTPDQPPRAAVAAPKAPVVPAASVLARPAAPAPKLPPAADLTATGLPRPMPKAVAGAVTANRIAGTRAKPKGPGPVGDPSAAARPGAAVSRSPTTPGGTFGTAKPRRNRTGLVFLVLVGLLLLSLALVAAWSSYLIGSDPADDTASLTTDAPLAQAVPAIEDEMLADMQDPEGSTDLLPEADPATAAVDLAVENAAINLAEDEAVDLPANTLADPAAEAVTSEPAPDATLATDIPPASAPVEDQDEIFLATIDAPPPALDALALPSPAANLDTVPEPPMPPPAFGTVYQFDASGRLLPTAEGILSPDGVMLISGKPPLLPPEPSAVAAAAAAASGSVSVVPTDTGAAIADETGVTAADASLVTGGAEATDAEAAVAAPVDPSLAGARPRPRPEGLVPSGDDDASLATGDDTSDFAGLRPLPRPANVLAAAAALQAANTAAAGVEAGDLGAQGASLAAQAEAERAAALALEATNPSIVAISMRPAARPRDFGRAVEAAVAAAARAPDPTADNVEVAAAPEGETGSEELDEVGEPEVAATGTAIPSKASVAKQATFANAINLSKTNLIGTYGTSSERYALVRQSNGRYKKVEVGDKIDGGRVEAITETEVRYEKNGKLVALKMPKS